MGSHEAVEVVDRSDLTDPALRRAQSEQCCRRVVVVFSGPEGNVMVRSDGRSIVDDDFNPIATDLDRSSQITVDEHEVAPVVRPASNRIGDGLDGANEVRTVPESDLDEIVVVGMIGERPHIRVAAQQAACIGSDGEPGELVERSVSTCPRGKTGYTEQCRFENDPIVEGWTAEVLVLEQGVASVTESQNPGGAHGVSSLRKCTPERPSRRSKCDCRTSDHGGMIRRPKEVDVEMTTQTIARTDIRRALVWGALLAVLWVVVALVRPASTFHLAPFLIAAAPPVLLVMDEGASAERASVLRIGAISAALALGATLLLLGIGAMEGPTFELFSSPLVEAVVFTAVGAVSGTGFGLWRTQ
jgi:hypothetical protein